MGSSAIVSVAREGAGAGESIGADVIHQGIKAAICPKAKALFDTTFDVAGMDAARLLAGVSAVVACTA